ncbi:MAG: beta-glucuronidase [Calditrichaeota bacterium]|nr:beta-glucuronidase [Calditrichota bacterium]RQW05808.1 MAG: beta-glucuronidase [Calditrichota bacterium]
MLGLFRMLIVTFLSVFTCLYASPLIINVDGRSSTDLHGNWNFIIDPYETGYYDYRYHPSENGYFKNRKPQTKSDRVEYSFDSEDLLHVPGDWNSQSEKLFLYEGTIWFKKSFNYRKKPDSRIFIYFGAINYQAKVYLNGEFVGEHEGGFTPFNSEITNLIKEEDNFLIVKADNRRYREAVPTLNTDWFNYGGITRRVLLVEVPETFVRDYFVQLDKNSRNKISGWAQLDGENKEQKFHILIPELKIDNKYRTDRTGYARFDVQAEPELWSPENPKLYNVFIETESDTIRDRIGFRKIEVNGTDILLNGKPVFLRGISIHEEAPFMDGARAYAREHAKILLNWAKELNCNFVRLAHYPHNEYMTRIADEIGLLVWSEIPVYWTILWENEATFNNARLQLTEMITRDKNRASVILWSMANETPVSEPRLQFLKKLADLARTLDPTRLITAAMERHYINEHTLMIDDPFGEYVDVLGCNSYIGWYDGLPAKCDSVEWKTIYDKPLIMSEFGAGALYGYHGDKLTRWTEEFQLYVYGKNLKMLQKIPFIRGMTPWILKDFRSPRRPLPVIQDFWNRKGLVSDKGQKKQAYYLLKEFYDEIIQKK